MPIEMDSSYTGASVDLQLLLYRDDGLHNASKIDLGCTGLI